MGISCKRISFLWNNKIFSDFISSGSQHQEVINDTWHVVKGSLSYSTLTIPHTEIKRSEKTSIKNVSWMSIWAVQGFGKTEMYTEK